MKKGKISAPYINIYGRTQICYDLLPGLPLYGLAIYVNLLCHPSSPSSLSLRPSQIAKDKNTQIGVQILEEYLL